MRHAVRPYWQIKNRRISQKRRWYSLFESFSSFLLEPRTPNYNYHSHNIPKGSVVYSYEYQNESFEDELFVCCTASPKKSGAKPHKWKLIALDRKFKRSHKTK